MGIRSTNTTQSFSSDFYRSGSDVTRAYVNQVYTEDVFHTQLYSGTGDLETINTGFDLLGKGGLVILKNKNQSLRDWIWTDTERGSYKSLRSSTSGDEGDDTDYGINLTSTGFTAGKSGTSNPLFNSTTADFCSWAFRKQPGFFDIQTFSGNNNISATQVINHNLGSVPGMVIIKKTSGTGGGNSGWGVHHRELGFGSGLLLNSSSNATFDSPITASSSTTITVASTNNANGNTYVAYLFAHDDHRFGDYEDQDIIKCEKATMPASGDWYDVDLGWEPQWILVKPDATTTNWQIFDSRRGIVTTGDSGVATGNERALNPNTPDGEETAAETLELTGNGFRMKVGQYGTNNDVYYVAIRKGMKKPTDATKVFNPVVYTGETDADGNALTQDFAPVDLYDGGRLFWSKIYTGTGNGTGHVLATNKTGLVSLDSTTSSSEVAFANIVWDDPEFVQLDSQYMNLQTNTHISWNFKTAAGFFDIVCAEGISPEKSDWPHSLGVAPELIMRKCRNNNYDWHIWSSYIVGDGGFNVNAWNESSGLWTYDGTNTNMTATTFSTSASAEINSSSDPFITLLFASCPGVSKVGTYSGSTGNNVDVDCGFNSNARFVMIKRTDTQISTPSQQETNWWIFDENLGITSGNDYVMQANAADARVTANWLSPHPDNKGFRVNSGAIAALNATGGTYLYLAIA